MKWDPLHGLFVQRHRQLPFCCLVNAKELNIDFYYFYLLWIAELIEVLISYFCTQGLSLWVSPDNQRPTETLTSGFVFRYYIWFVHMGQTLSEHYNGTYR